MGMVPPPWLMWGKDQTMQMIRPAGAGTYQQDTGQLARINYGRPETWRFLLGFDIPDVDLVGGPLVVQVAFNLTIGVGRGSTRLRNFGFFQFANPLPPIQIQYATKVFTPRQVFSDANTVSECDEFVAQDIQCDATVVASGITAGTQLTINVFSYFAPNSHIRPEWFHKPPPTMMPTEQFRGAEDKGT
jgi:hypothetical protein